MMLSGSGFSSGSRHFPRCLDLDVPWLILFFFSSLLSLLVGFPSAAEQCFLRSSAYGSGEETNQLAIYLGVNAILSMTFSQDRDRQGELWD